MAKAKPPKPRRATKRDVLQTLRPRLKAQRLQLRARVRALELELGKARRELREAMRPPRGTQATLCKRLRGLEGSCKPAKLERAPRKPRGGTSSSSSVPVALRSSTKPAKPTAFVMPAAVGMFSAAAARPSDMLETVPPELRNGAEWDAGDGFVVSWGGDYESCFVQFGHGGPRRNVFGEAGQLHMSVARHDGGSNPAHQRVVATWASKPSRAKARGSARYSAPSTNAASLGASRGTNGAATCWPRVVWGCCSSRGGTSRQTLKRWRRTSCATDLASRICSCSSSRCRAWRVRKRPWLQRRAPVARARAAFCAR